MYSEKNRSAFYTFHRIKLSDRGIGMVSHVSFKTLKITSNTAGFINFEFRRNIFPWPHAYGTGHVDISGSEKPVVYVEHTVFFQIS